MYDVFIKDNIEISSQEIKEWLVNFNLYDKFKDAKNISIKVNLCAGNHMDSKTGVVTNKELLIDFILSLKEITNANILICESDSIGNCKAYDKFEFQGYYNLEKYGIKTLDLTRSEMIDCDLDKAEYFKEGILLSKEFIESDIIISFGKIKTHSITIFSGSMKNLFGCLPLSDKDRYHTHLSEVLKDLYKVISPQLSILESSPGMEGYGPVHGDTVHSNIFVISNDAMLADIVACRIIGIDPIRVDYLKEKAKETIRVNREIPSFKYNYISKNKRFFVKFGLILQKIGESFYKIGHIVHGIRGFNDLFVRLTKKIKGRS